MDNSALYAIESLGAKVYFFGECVWATILKLPVTQFKLAIVGGNPAQILPALEKYKVELVKQTLKIVENDILYEFHFPTTLEEIPLDIIPLNNSILGLDGKMFRATDLATKTIHIPENIILDHPEVMLTACRIVAQTNFTLNIGTWLSIHDYGTLIKAVIKRNPAFIGKELDEILLSKYPSAGLQLMRETKLLDYILPELSACHSISQTRRGENTNVFAHIMLTIEAAENDRVIRWSMLFHDIGKPATLEISEEGKMHFFKHELVGAKLAEEYMTRYKMSKDLIVRTKRLIEYHMFDADPKLTPKGVRRLLRRVGKENIFDLIRVREADRKGATRPPSMDKIELLKQKIIKELPNL
ncbi:MAG: HDIG domain-containing metalloprotein [Candidatus Paceibacterota bacterium]|jgi:putative nucleotidyltransferase with HDIG domain